MTWVISRILPYTLATCIHSGLRMHTPGVKRVLTQGLSYIGCLHCYLRSVLFVDGHPNQSNLYLHNSAILNLDNPSKNHKKPTGFFFPKHLSPATPLLDPTARGFSPTSMATRPPSTKACAMAAAPEASWETRHGHTTGAGKNGMFVSHEETIYNLYIYTQQRSGNNWNM